jgi:hypothetical protein
MEIIITENQFEKLKNSEEPKVLNILSFEIFGNDWGRLQRYLERKGNPLYSVGGDLDLQNTPIKSLGNLTSVGGGLNLENTPMLRKYSEQEIKQMVNIEGSIYL